MSKKLSPSAIARRKVTQKENERARQQATRKAFGMHLPRSERYKQRLKLFEEHVEQAKAALASWIAGKDEYINRKD